MGNRNSQIGDYEVDLTRKLGDGSFGDVYEGHVKANKQKIAVKKCTMKSKDGMEVATEEIKTMEYIPTHETEVDTWHVNVLQKHIVEFLDFHFHDDAAWVFMEFCELGHLGQVMASSHVTGPDVKVDIMLQCTQGLFYLHTLEHPIVHRDLKPQNVLFCRLQGKLVAKLADFGLSKIMYVDTLLKTEAGTALYMAPEISTAKYYSRSVDIFSLGLLFLAMVLYDSVGKLIPISATAVSGQKMLPVGQEMTFAASRKRPMPIVAIPSPHDQHQMREVKRLINKMVVYESDQRLPLPKVQLHLKELLSIEEIEHDSGVNVADFSLHSTASGKDAGESILRCLMRQTLMRANSAASEDSAVAALTSLSQGLSLSDTLDSITHKRFKIGERVIVSADQEYVKQVQKTTCGWVRSMARYTGADGWVYDLQGCDVYTIKFDDGYRFTYSGKVLEKYSGRAVPLPWCGGPFKVGDMVTVTGDSKLLQSKQTRVQEYDSRMHMARGRGGVVQRITTECLCEVECFNGDIWRFDPDLLQPRDVAHTRLGVDDVVMISPSRDLVKREMADCGLTWNSDNEKCLDATGVVVEVTSRRVVRVKTEGLKVDLPTTVLTHYATKREIEKAQLVKAVVEKAANTYKSKK